MIFSFPAPGAGNTDWGASSFKRELSQGWDCYVTRFAERPTLVPLRRLGNEHLGLAGTDEGLIAWPEVMSRCRRPKNSGLHLPRTGPG